MSAEICRSNAYVGFLPTLSAALARLRQFWRRRVIVLDDRLEQEGLSPHLARDLGLNDASLVYDSRHADRGL